MQLRRQHFDALSELFGQFRQFRILKPLTDSGDDMDWLRTAGRCIRAQLRTQQPRARMATQIALL